MEKANINFKPLTDFEKLAYSNLYAVELKKENKILETRLVILLKLLRQQKKVMSKHSKKKK
jgi:hypothetical protein